MYPSFPYPIRIIPCLDIDAGRVVKGVQFVEIRDAGDPVDAAQRYYEQGADEIVFLDITASHEDRDTIIHVVEAVASRVFIPLTVGGGVRTTENIRALLRAGADKVAINSAAIADPALINQAARIFGTQCIVIAIDAKAVAENQWHVYTHGGRRDTGIDAVDWAKEVYARGAGEILLTSMDRDGTKNGFDLSLTRAISDAVPVPVIASGGVGTIAHMADGIINGHADAVLAAASRPRPRTAAQTGPGRAAGQQRPGHYRRRPDTGTGRRYPVRARRQCRGRGRHCRDDARAGKASVCEMPAERGQGRLLEEAMEKGLDPDRQIANYGSK